MQNFFPIKSKSFQRHELIATQGVTFHLLLATHGNSLVAHCKICLLLPAEVARCNISLVTCSNIHWLLVAEVACCKKSLVTRSKMRLLFVTEVARFKNSLITRCKTCSL